MKRALYKQKQNSYSKKKKSYILLKKSILNCTKHTDIQYLKKKLNISINKKLYLDLSIKEKYINYLLQIL